MRTNCGGLVRVSCSRREGAELASDKSSRANLVSMTSLRRKDGQIAGSAGVTSGRRPSRCKSGSGGRPRRRTSSQPRERPPSTTRSSTAEIRQLNRSLAHL
jgi:hypothetical protein